jgi:hypothetical protein
VQIPEFKPQFHSPDKIKRMMKQAVICNNIMEYYSAIKRKGVSIHTTPG